MGGTAIKVQDPVCGMSVDPATARRRGERAGKTYYFCGAGCADKFKAAPEKYLQSPARLAASGLVTLVQSVPGRPHAVVPVKPAPAQPGGYVCPMCPEVRKTQPGPCPSCGMALEPEMPAATARTEYTCPMHPEIVRSAPGSCPICGMTLEPRTVAAAGEENPELSDMTRRFWASLALTVPLMAIAMVSMLWPRAFMGGIDIARGGNY